MYVHILHENKQVMYIVLSLLNFSHSKGHFVTRLWYNEVWNVIWTVARYFLNVAIFFFIYRQRTFAAQIMYVFGWKYSVTVGLQIVYNIYFIKFLFMVFNSFHLYYWIIAYIFKFGKQFHAKYRLYWQCPNLV